ncbi:hypothetical protein RUND412_000957 [Rhizina undulata]
MFACTNKNSVVINRDNTVTDSYNSSSAVNIEINNGVQARDDERFKILAWLSKVNYQEHHKFIVGVRQANTGNWLFKKKDFIEWEKSASSIFWLHGIAGAGKTVLASTVIDMFTKRMPTNLGLAYFYCKYGEKERQEPESILSTAVKQLSLLSPKGFLPEPVISLYRKQKNDGVERRLWLDESTELILQLSKAFGQTVIIVDALDECDKETRCQFLDALKELQSSSKSLKIFITSRNDDDIRIELENESDIYIQLSDNSSDIELFVDTEVGKYISRKRLLGGIVPPELKQTIIDTLRNEADGMFLWVRLQIEHICREKSKKAILKALKRLPKDLTATYLVIWKKIHADTEANCLLAQRTLQWILCAKSPLTEKQILDAVSITPMQWTEKPNHDGVTHMTLLDVCQNLVVLDEELGVLRTAHFSVTEFLLERLDINQAHTTAAEVCLTLLCCEDHVNTSRPTVNYILDNFYLYDYVMNNWAEHILLSGEGSSTLEDLQKMFFKPSAAYSKWISAASKRKIDLLPSGDKERCLNPLWVACNFQLWDIYKYLLHSKPDCTMTNYCGLAPIHLIAKYGYCEGMKLLLEQEGVDWNAKDKYGETPLNHAVHSGHEAVVRLLLEQEGVDLNVKNYDGQGLRDIAANKGHLKIVRLLDEVSQRY